MQPNCVITRRIFRLIQHRRSVSSMATSRLLMSFRKMKPWLWRRQRDELENTYWTGIWKGTKPWVVVRR